jgi:hypothetical protein
MWLHHGHCPDFESYPQWNDEVRAVYAMARYDDGRPHLLAIAPYFPTKECAWFSFRYRLRQSRVGRAMMMDPLRRW